MNAGRQCYLVAQGGRLVSILVCMILVSCNFSRVRAVSCARVGLSIDSARADAMRVFSTFHVAYHATTVAAVESILKTGTLAKAGDKVIAADDRALDTVPIRDGHYKKPFKRVNLHTGAEEMFDPHQVFLSPVSEYCFHSYANAQR